MAVEEKDECWTVLTHKHSKQTVQADANITALELCSRMLFCNKVELRLYYFLAAIICTRENQHYSNDMGKHQRRE
jgi:hypothetical protein